MVGQCHKSFWSQIILSGSKILPNLMKVLSNNLNLMNNTVLWQKWKMRVNIEIIDLSLKKEEETVWCQNQIIMLQSFSQKICWL